jgi:hypothetical protein
VARAGRIAGWSVVAMLLAVQGATAACVWTGGDSGAAGRFLQDWTATRGHTLEQWGVDLANEVARIELITDAGAFRVTVTLGDDCTVPPTAVLQSGGQANGFPSDADLAALAVGFPADRRDLGVEETPQRSDTGPLSLPFAILAVIAAAVAAATPRQRTARWVSAMSIVAMVGVAAWPLLFQPFQTDAQIIRAAATATNIFGDVFHPFLPFALNRPTTWFSIEPWALRLVPLAFLGLETLLLVLATARTGGGVAGALAGIWFACEVRRRHGLWDLSDWDVAGTFLMAMLLVLQRPWASTWRGTLGLAVLMGAGLASSWLMIIPDGVLLGSIGIEVLRRRWPILPAVFLGTVFAGLAFLTLRVFSAGSHVAPEIDATALWTQMFEELPIAREWAMALPMALGLGWLLLRIDRVAPRFVATCLLVVPVAVVLAHQKSHVAGGYYIGLVTPLLLYAAAVATVRLASRLATRLPWGDAAVVRIAATLALVVATVVRSAPGGAPPTIDHLRLLADETRADDWPIYTNRIDFVRLMAFERARAGADALTIDSALNGPADLRGRVFTTDVCPPPASADGRGTYVAISHPAPEQGPCLEALARRCRNLGPADAHDWVLLRCTP